MSLEEEIKKSFDNTAASPFREFSERTNISDPTIRVVAEMLAALYMRQNTAFIYDSTDREQIELSVSIKLLENILKNVGETDLIQQLLELAEADFKKANQK
jgi:hypothetical protein